MIDERFATSVSAWLRRTDASSRHAEDNVGHAMAQIHRTRQRRRWLWFLPGPKPTAGAEARLDRGRLPASTMTNHIGGTTTMISPAKMVAAAAVAALAGTLLLAGQNMTQDPGPSIADSQELGEISTTQGQAQFLTKEDGASTAYDQGYATTDELITLAFEMDDPRLSGAFQGVVNGYSFGIGGPNTSTGNLENEGGSWTAHGRGYSAPPTGGLHQQFVLTGQEGYEGLSAILSADQDRKSTFFDVRGVVFTGGLPPFPDPAPMSTE